jgi:hypothetical protein
VTASRSSHLALTLLGAGSILLEACVHNIHVAPVADLSLTRTIDQTVSVDVPFLALQGPDRMPGIAMLQWPAADLRNAIVEYAKQRGTFVGTDHQGALAFVVRGWLFMRSRQAYHYIVHLEADLGPAGKPPTKSYVVRKETVGSRVRWATASDQEPIAEAVKAALDDLFLQIEEDATLYGRR